MKLHLDRSCLFRDCEHFVKKHFYKKAYQLALQHSIMRFSGPIIGVDLGGFRITKKIASIGEAVFKGFVNIFGAPFSTSCSLSKGIQLLTKHTIIHLCKVPLSVLSAISGLFMKTISTLILNSEYLYDKWNEHASAGTVNDDPDFREEQATRARHQQNEVARTANQANLQQQKLKEET